LANYGILPLTFEDSADWNDIQQDDVLRLDNLQTVLSLGRRLDARNLTRDRTYRLNHILSERQLKMVLAGGLINAIRKDH
jgi:aconitate hydratase